LKTPKVIAKSGLVGLKALRGLHTYIYIRYTEDKEGARAPGARGRLKELLTGDG